MNMTPATFQPLMSALKAEADENIPDKSLALAVFHFERSPLNMSLLENA